MSIIYILEIIVSIQSGIFLITTKLSLFIALILANAIPNL